MQIQDILIIFIILGIIILAICIVFVTFYLTQALKSITSLSDNLDETAQNIKMRIQQKAFAAIPGLIIGLISRVIKRRR